MDGLKNDVKRQAGKDHDILLERPVIYIHVWQSAEDAADNKWSIYIGESINLMERTRGSIGWLQKRMRREIRWCR